VTIKFSPAAEPGPLPTLPVIPDDGSVHVIPLNRGLCTLIDKADIPLIKDWRFSAGNPNGNYWQVRAHRGSRADNTQELSYLHTILTGFAVTDHRNGNGFDNRRSNLREATVSQNNRNRARQVNNTSGLKSVSWHKNTRKWQASIRIDGHLRHLGYFPAGNGTYIINGQEYDKGLVDAALAYDAAAREHHKQFATLNFPLIGERSAITGEIRDFDSAAYPELVRR
jgi:hypothetical protein